MTKFRFAIIIIYLLLISQLLYADKVSFAYLKITPSAREQAMGSCGVVSALGPQAMYYNPALTSQITKTVLNINYHRWFLDMYGQSLFVVRPFNYLNLGFGVVNFNAGTLELRPDHPTQEVIGEFNPNDFNLYFNVSHQIKASKNPLMLGISLRYYYSKIYDATASGYGFDAGLCYQLSNNLRLGIALNNFATKMRYQREKFNVPRRLSGGVEYLLPLKTNQSYPNLKLSSDLSYFFYEKRFYLNSGIELSVTDRYYFLTGYRLGEQANHLSLGMGFVVKTIRFEYAYSLNALDLNPNHHFSINFGY